MPTNVATPHYPSGCAKWNPVAQAVPLDGIYPTGQRVSDAEMAALHLTKHEVCPSWNYTIYPRSAVAVAASLAVTVPNQEVIV
jgi:hypothetical protein